MYNFFYPFYIFFYVYFTSFYVKHFYHCVWNMLYKLTCLALHNQTGIIIPYYKIQ